MTSSNDQISGEIELFEGQFPEIRSQGDLDEQIRRNPRLDPAYLLQGWASTRAEIRARIEELWRVYQPYADANFHREFKTRFAERAWELYLGAALLLRGHKLQKVGRRGPDLKVILDAGPVWIEAVVTTPGEGPDRVPEYDDVEIHNVPEDEMLLRITNALATKKGVYDKYVADGVVDPKTPFIIAVNRSPLHYLDAMIPLALKSLYGVGHLQISIQLDKPTPEKAKQSWTHRPLLQKRSGGDVSMRFFQDRANSGISAVFYCVNSIVNSPTAEDVIGDDIVVVYNDLASSPVPGGFPDFGQHWKVIGDELRTVRQPGGSQD